MVRRLLPAAVCALIATGCYAHNRIPPEELPRLNQMSSNSVQQGNVVVTTQTVQNVRRTDGTMLRVVGEFSASVVPRDQSRGSVDFSTPVESHVEGTDLLVAGGNRAGMRFPIEQIDYIDISTYDAGLSTLAISLINFLVAGAAAGITLGILFAN